MSEADGFMGGVIAAPAVDTRRSHEVAEKLLRRDAIENLGRSILLETIRAVASQGGILSEDGVRESLRQARVFYSELAKPTKRKTEPKPAQEQDEGADIGGLDEGF